MKIQVFTAQKDMAIKKLQVKKLVSHVLQFLNCSCEELSVYFVNKQKIGELHEQYFQDPSPTDCITFPIDEAYLGDIFVCPLVAKEYAIKRKADPWEELSLYIVHGILHLLGYDDLEKSAKRTMRKKEKSCMHYLKEQNTLLHI